MTRSTRADVFGFVAADVAGKAHEVFLFFFFAGHANLVGIDHDDEIAGIDMRSENRLLFSAQQVCRFDRDATENLIFGIDQPPLAVDFTGLRGKRLHRRLKKGTEATGQVVDCQPTESGRSVVSNVLSRNYNARRISSRLCPPRVARRLIIVLNKSTDSLVATVMTAAVWASELAATAVGAQPGAKYLL